jgi:hypothetical protein
LTKRKGIIQNQLALPPVILASWYGGNFLNHQPHWGHLEKGGSMITWLIMTDIHQVFTDGWMKWFKWFVTESDLRWLKFKG